ncbi:bifunctional DNA primase/polymerase [Micromonospora sp. NPDC047187]|uniref:bifunctional DNA primase/polymerase n=1 Tax=Micromonospora sp. NPDC047187 TaxID=3155262 RepID=UPI0033F407D3
MARVYVGDGLWPVPLRPADKRPKYVGWQSHKPEDALLYFENSGHKYIGVQTGHQKGNLVVVEVDDRNGGEESLSKFPEPTQRGCWETRVHRSKSGGPHFWFYYDKPLRTRHNRPGPGIDIIGDGGLVVAPGTPGYTVSHNVDPLPLPQYFIDLCSAPPENKFPPLGGLASNSATVKYINGDPHDWANSALAGSVDDISGAQSGRYNLLNLKAYRLGGMIAGGYLEEAEVRTALIAAGITCGLDLDRQVIPTVNNAIADGKMRPIRFEQTRIGG